MRYLTEIGADLLSGLSVDATSADKLVKQFELR
jgi:hypothetical protein